jgi:hypothetical protein
MLKHLAQRMLMSEPVLLGVLLLGFPLLQLVPGDVARVNAGPTETQDVVDQILGDLGLDRPLAVQFRLYLGRVLQGDLACRSSRASASPDQMPAGCRFAPRCALADGRCHAEEPPLRALKPGHHVACRKAPIEMTTP